MVMLSTVSGTFSASSAAAQMWCRVQPAGKHSSYWNSLDMRQSWAHSLPLYQREKKHRLKTTWPAKEFCALNLSTSVCWQTPRGKRSMSCSREVHTVPFRKTFWIWDQAMVYPIPKWGSHSRERSAKNRATDANTAWRQGEEGTGQANHRTQPPPPAEDDFLLSTPSRDTGTWMLMTYLGESKPASCRSGECRVNLALKSWSCTADFQAHLLRLQTTAGTTSVYWSVGFHRPDCLGFSQGFPLHYVRLISEANFLKSISCLKNL